MRDTTADDHRRQTLITSHTKGTRMTRTSAQRRLVRRSAALAGVLTLCAVGTAHADITGTVTNTAGFPVPGASIEVTKADGNSASFKTTDANGAYTVLTSSLTTGTPFTVKATFSDSCKPFATAELSSTSGAIADGATQNFTLDASAFCGTSFPPSGAPAMRPHPPKPFLSLSSTLPPILVPT